ncbi:hypothetical protein G4B88_005279 [Cannabis sativa]|uniref:Uncharacterized protein n=1 Tax=Cannabis sativa TaxID=3483 RepID=A0A7J6HD49_CANSA|nr:hypothetical protein G4B88_005279 [Cannabis sativa]
MKKGPLGQNQLQLHLYTYTYTILFPSSLPETKKNQVLQEPIMISVLAQERLLGAALGSIFTGMVVFEQRRSIYKSISDTQPQLNSQFQACRPRYLVVMLRVARFMVLKCFLNIESGRDEHLQYYPRHHLVLGHHHLLPPLLDHHLQEEIFDLYFISTPIFKGETHVREPIFGKEARSELARMWNKGVDQAFGPAIQYLNSHGW